MKYLVIIFLSGFALCSKGQNLIINGGFENLSICVNPPQPLNIVDGWYSPSKNTPDIFHNCFVNDQCLVPATNCHGIQATHNGDGYGGGVWFFYNREYLADKLTEPLKPNQAYCLEFYLNLANQPTNTIAIDRVGVYFSNDSVYYDTFFELPVTPQLETPEWQFFNDTINWVKVELQYVAHGGERYIVFGNFRPDSLTHTQYLDTIAFQGYYYIDDVSLVECKGNAVDENSIVKQVNVYPNPATDNFTIQYNINTASTFELFNIQGKKLDAVDLPVQSSSYTYNAESLANGVYLYSITGIKGKLAAGKLVLIN